MFSRLKESEFLFNWSRFVESFSNFVVVFTLQGHVRFHTGESCDSVLKTMSLKGNKVTVEKLTGKYFIVLFKRFTLPALAVVPPIVVFDRATLSEFHNKRLLLGFNVFNTWHVANALA